MPSRRSSERTRTKILDAAERTFSEMGFRGTSTREIARRARMDKYAIYYHFHDKEALYRAMIERSFSRMTRFIEELFPRAGMTLEEMERTFEDILEYIARSRAILKIMQRESLDETVPGTGEIFQAYFKPLYRKGLRFSEKNKRMGVFRKDVNSRQFIMSLYAMIMSYANDAALIGLLLGEDPHSRKMIRERKAMLARFVMDSLSQGPLREGTERSDGGHAGDG